MEEHDLVQAETALLRKISMSRTFLGAVDHAAALLFNINEVEYLKERMGTS